MYICVYTLLRSDDSVVCMLRGCVVVLLSAIEGVHYEVRSVEDADGS
jgi:hypothetical protein